MSIYQAVRSRIGTGRKRRFGVAGLINLVVCNGFLQALLAANTPVAISTLLAQIVNGLLGYLTYGKYAFRASIRDLEAAKKYTALAGLLWIGNWSGISALQNLGTPKSLGSIAMILPLAATSFIVQRKWVFRKP
jgi:putative flippase GtrA